MAIRRAEYDYLLPTAAGEQLLLAPGCCHRWQAQHGTPLPAAARQRRRHRAARCWQLVCIEISSGRARRMPANSAIYLPAVVA
jgi:acyl-CoA thioester hydrolase